ncbi:MAG: cytochrome c [Planctomycetota bacterium]|nr:cytochrome c [Planctomycetota bacterium]
MKNRAAPPWIALATVFACALGLSACGEKPDEPGGETAEVGSQEPQDVHLVYLAQCAVCHGAEGDGNGIVKLDRPARSFKKGAFSFGNTPEALYRTISNGIGGTPMPGFKDFLSEELRRELAAYVIELGPEQEPVVPGASELHVTDNPRVIRGGLPPIADGMAPVTRGLLVGGTDGLTFEYNTKPVALLGVRQGGFVDRKDWGGRGGAQLQPLGVVSHVVDPGSHTFMWMRATADGSTTPLQARFVASSIEAGLAWIEYELPGTSDSEGDSPVLIREHGAAVSAAGWPGFRRLFTTGHVSGFDGLQLSLLEAESLSEVANGGSGRVLVGSDSDGAALVHVVHMPVLLRPGMESRWLVDTLYGLEPTEENLKGLKELVQ